MNVGNNQVLPQLPNLSTADTTTTRLNQYTTRFFYLHVPVNMERTTINHNDRLDSSKLVDLHVYIIPKQVWKNRQNLAENETIDRAISVGFVRVPENLTIHDLRRYIIETCSRDINFSKDFVYLRSVGRCLTKVKQQQEKDLKVKHYRPPTTVASEIYLLENCRDTNSSISGCREEYSMRRSSMNPQTRKRSFDHNRDRGTSTSIPYLVFPIQLSSQMLLKRREEQDRLYLRQIELARQRHEIEEQQNREGDAAIKIQTAFRNYRDRHHTKQQQQQEDDSTETELSENGRKHSTPRKTDDEHEIVEISHRLKDLGAKRTELETNRELVIHRMKQLNTQLTIRRRQEKDLWKQKYLIEKNQITASEEQNRSVSKNPTDIQNQLRQTTLRLNKTTKLRRRAEYELRVLRHELQQISSSLNAIERHRLPKKPSYSRQRQTEPISLDITVQY